MEAKVFSHFNLLVKAKRPGATGVRSSTLLSEVRLLEGENLVGSDVCRCNVLLPFEDVPGVLGKVCVRRENGSWKLFLQSLANDSPYFLSKVRGKRMPGEKQHFIKPNQKVFVADSLVLSVQKVFYFQDSSVCFEEEAPGDAQPATPEGAEALPAGRESPLGKRSDADFVPRTEAPRPAQLETPKKRKRAKKAAPSGEKTSVKILSFFKRVDPGDKKTAQKPPAVAPPKSPPRPSKNLFGPGKAKAEAARAEKGSAPQEPPRAEPAVQVWVCFSNVAPTTRHSKVLEKLQGELRFRVFENFEAFANAAPESEAVRKVLVMSEYKRTYKLLVACNLDIPVLKYEWVLRVADGSRVLLDVAPFLVLGAKQAREDAEQGLLRCPSQRRFLKGCNVVIFEKCFRELRPAGLGNARPDSGSAPRKGIRSGKREQDHQHIMRRIVETAAGEAEFTEDLSRLKPSLKRGKRNLLVVDKLRYSFLEDLKKRRGLLVLSKESFLNSVLRQGLPLK